MTTPWRESTIGLYKTGCTRHEGPWCGVDDLELATLNWVSWLNQTRLHSGTGHVRRSNSRTGTTVRSTPAAAAAGGTRCPPLNPGRFSIPDTAWPVADTRQAIPGSTRTPQFRCHLSSFRHVSNDSPALASRSPPDALSRRLLLIARYDQVFSQRSMRWFGASLRRATPKGQDP